MSTVYLSNAAVPTPDASRYLRHLCNEWSKKRAVDFDDWHGRITFPSNAELTLEAAPEGLVCSIAASDPKKRDRLKRKFVRRLERLAPLACEWQDV